MGRLKYKTRGMTTPQGKPRVYFCSHPEDFGRYFERISDELLTKQNCAVWYDERPDMACDRELLEDLEQMQLFVMPVTARLLCTRNDALDVKFRFAMEHHIPVLPLMQEGGLEGLFNEKCGDLQFLDPYSRDTTAISYDEKLEKYLSAVLIGDELAAKIRSAFDAYVFLSYRKKDRKYAQELMRLIHKNDFCRDIAIWYDEFLTPGENFNDSIRDALLKSDLFVLAVTPNLVNETNYIMTTEYPMAVEGKKPVLPVELVPTARERLSASYHNIPLCVDAKNDAQLSQALLASIRKMAIRENDASAEHNFFIGLAYLGGVDVEVDHHRAVSLITSAAESGLEEAVRKLIDMYQNGIGVDIDHRRVIHWQVRLVEILRNKLASSKKPDFDEIIGYLNSILFLGTKYFDTNSFDEAMKAYNLILECCKKFSAYLGVNAKILSSACYNNMAVVCAQSNQVSKGIDYHKKAIALRKALLKKYPGEIAGDLMDSYINLGIAYDNAGQRKKAVEALNDAVALYEAYSGKVDVDVLKLAQAHRIMGGILSMAGDYTAAAGYYRKANAIYDKRMQNPSPAVREGYADNCYKLGIHYVECGDYPQSEANFLTALEHYLVLVRRDELSYIYEFANTNYELALLYRQWGKKEQALEMIRRAVAIWKRAEEIGKTNYATFARSHRLHGEILTDLGQFSEAVTAFGKAESYLAKVTLSHETAIEFIHLYNCCGRVYYRMYKNQQSQDMYRKAWELHFQYYHFDKDQQKILGIIYYNFALLCYHNYHDSAAAREMLDKAMKVFAKAPGCTGLYLTASEFRSKI